MSLFKRILIGLTILLLVGVGAAAWLFRSRAETIPDQLAPINTELADPMKVVVPGSSGLPDLKLADLRGKTVYLVVGDRESMQAGESKLFDRALNRWTFPDDVVGYGIADAEGFKILASKIEEFLGGMRPEIRLPLYIDYEGAITRAFQLPKGHVGVVVLGPDSQILLRHSGPPPAGAAGDALIEKLRATLRAEEPTLEPAPPFKLGALDNAACEGKTCMFVFLSRPVKKSELPGVKGGWEGETDAMWKQLQDPDVRLTGLVYDSDAKLVAAADKSAKSAKSKDSADESEPLKPVEVVLVGAVEDIELKRYTVVPEAAEARVTFKVPDAGIVVIDPEGRIVLHETGLVRMFKFTRISELLGVDLSDRRE